MRLRVVDLDESLSLVDASVRRTGQVPARVVSYLKAGVVVCVAPGIEFDRFALAKVRIPYTPTWYTDGQYSWSSSLIYYCENYQVQLPQDFLRHMESNRWQVDADTVDLAAIEFGE